MRFSFHPDAEAEFDQAVAYYEIKQSGLGLSLADEVLVAVTRILDYPEAGQPFSKNTRRCLAKRFPYGLIYQIHEDMVGIIAVAHLSRRPGYWEKRV
ncbi:MAG: type II toxin-antitoxin system RelE/ParE family toxin [Nitrospirales bacterium]